ncbi:hypothetical protein KY306_02880 [Candidatus Woesearchaeota archaeon]|nr:hypothetical protein [Candidatus Woesearchaeota archaeon]
MWKHTRKGQLEIMGLVVVVVLISLGMLFLLKFVVFKPVGEERATFTRSQLSTNTLNALLVTTTDCRNDADLKISDLIQKCVETGEECNNYNNMDSCDFLEEKIGEILNDTLVAWKKDYLFRVYLAEQPSYSSAKVQHKGCPGEKDTALFFLPRIIGQGQIFIRLEVCD